MNKIEKYVYDAVKFCTLDEIYDKEFTPISI